MNICLSVTKTATLWQDFSKTLKFVPLLLKIWLFHRNNSKQIRICSFAQVYFIFLLLSVSVTRSSSMCQFLQPGTLKTTLFPLIQNLWKVKQSESELVSSSSSGHCCVLWTGAVGGLWVCCLRLALHLQKMIKSERLQSKGVLYTCRASLRKCNVIEQLTPFPQHPWFFYKWTSCRNVSVKDGISPVPH